MNRLINISKERHDLIAKGLDYLMDSIKSWWILLFIATAMEVGLYYVEGILELFGIITIPIILIACKYSLIKMPDVLWLTSCYELVVWIFMGTTLFSILSTKENFAHQLILLVLGVLISYLICDCIEPPRKRKKVKVTINSPQQSRVKI